MGIFENVFTTITNRIADAVASRVLTDSGQRIAQARAYRLGLQPHQLKVKPGQYDDNLILNFTGLIINRSVSQIIGKGVSFKFDGDDGQTELPQKDYVSQTWDANHQELLLHRAVLSAAEAGTGYILICDPALGMGAAVENGMEYPRLMLLDPAYMTIEVMPEDFEIVIRYIEQYKFTGVDGKERARRKIVERDMDSGRWTITDYESTDGTYGKFIRVGEPLLWPYDFPPILHWQNLPTVDSPYGEPEIDGSMMATQDSLNAEASALNKSLRLGIDALKVFTGESKPDKFDVGPDKAVWLGANGAAMQLAPSTDWAGSLAFAKMVRGVLFDISRTVDIDTINDRLGSLTNFALKVLYQDNSAKIATKCELLGDALEELNRRLMIMAGMEPVETEVIWPDFMPVNESERSQYYLNLLNAGVISKQTACEELGYSWDDESERMSGEAAASDNIGGALLAAFNRGESAGLPALTLPGRAPQMAGINGQEANPPE